MAICLSEEPEDHVKAATAWSLGQIGRHTPEHARAVAAANVLPKLLARYMDTESSDDLQIKVQTQKKHFALFMAILGSVLLCFHKMF